MARWVDSSFPDCMGNTITTSHDLQRDCESLGQPSTYYPCFESAAIDPLQSTLTMTLPELQLFNDHHVSCGYRNASDRMVIVRCLGPDQFFLERVVFPFELLSFYCPSGTDVQIWTHGLGGPELLETIQAADLLIEANTSTPLPLPLEELTPWSQAS